MLRDVDSSFYGNVDVGESEQDDPGYLGSFKLAPMAGGPQETERLDEIAKGLAARGFERLHLVLLRHGTSNTGWFICSYSWVALT